jgi:ribose 5-phosphate isomerase
LTSNRFIGITQQKKTQDELKQMVGYKSVDEDYVKSGMVVSLGTGSTANFAVEGTLEDIVAIPTSIRTKKQT